MERAPSIIFIIPYFGRWPFWMPFFIESCRFNPDIDWLLVGDCAQIDDLPDNVRQKVIGFSEYCEWVSQRLNIKFSPKNPYKLCDLKPALGYLHEDEITGYDYWGFSDLDLIYGNLRAYFTDERLRRYKLLSTHERRVSGHLCLLKNERSLRELFWRIPDFKQRIQDPSNHALDEGGFSRIFLWRKNFPEFLFRFVGLFNPWRRVAEFREAFSTPNAGRPWVDGSMDFPSSWVWREGRLTNSKDGGREFPYLHFMSWKKKDWAKLDCDRNGFQRIAKARAWVVDGFGFHSGANDDF